MSEAGPCPVNLLRTLHQFDRVEAFFDRAGTGQNDAWPREKSHARFGGKDVRGFLPYFGHPEQVFFWIYLLEDRIGRGELIPRRTIRRWMEEGLLMSLTVCDKSRFGVTKAVVELLVAVIEKSPQLFPHSPSQKSVGYGSPGKEHAMTSLMRVVSSLKGSKRC